MLIQLFTILYLPILSSCLCSYLIRILPFLQRLTTKSILQLNKSGLFQQNTLFTHIFKIDLCPLFMVFITYHSLYNCVSSTFLIHYNSLETFCMYVRLVSFIDLSIFKNIYASSSQGHSFKHGRHLINMTGNKETKYFVLIPLI